MAFIFTQCGLSYALRSQQGEGGRLVAEAIDAPIERPVAQDADGELAEAVALEEMGGVADAQRAAVLLNKQADAPFSEGRPASATGTVQIPKAVDVKKHIMNMLRTYSDTAEGIETVTVQEIVNKLAESHAYNIAKIPDSEKLLSQRLGLRKGTRKQFWMERLTKVTKKCLDELVKARQIVPDGPNAYKVAKASLKITIGPGEDDTASAAGEDDLQQEITRAEQALARAKQALQDHNSAKPGSLVSQESLGKLKARVDSAEQTLAARQAQAVAGATPQPTTGSATGVAKVIVYCSQNVIDEYQGDIEGIIRGALEGIGVDVREIIFKEDSKTDIALYFEVDPDTFVNPLFTLETQRAFVPFMTDTGITVEAHISSNKELAEGATTETARRAVHVLIGNINADDVRAFAVQNVSPSTIQYPVEGLFSEPLPKGNTRAGAIGFTKSLLETYDNIAANCEPGETIEGMELFTGNRSYSYALSGMPDGWLMYDMSHAAMAPETVPRPVPSDFCARLQLKNIVSIKFAGKVFDVDRDALISALDVMEGIAGSILNETEKAAASESSKTDITDKIYYRWANSRYSDLAFRVYKPDPQSPELVVEVTIYKSVAAKIAGPGNEEVKLRRLTTIDVPGSAKAGATGREIATAVRDALNHQHIEAVAVLENVRQAGDLDGIKEVVDGYREGVDLSAKAAKNVADADQANRLTREVLDTLEDEFEIAEAFYNGEFFNAPTVGKAVQLVDGYVEGVRERLAKAEEKVNIAAEAEKRNALISGLDADSTSRVKRMLVRIGFYDDEEHIKIIDGELTFEALEEARQLYSIVITQDNANDPLNMYMQDSEGVQQMSVAANIEDLKKQVEAWISV